MKHYDMSNFYTSILGTLGTEVPVDLDSPVYPRVLDYLDTGVQGVVDYPRLSRTVQVTLEYGIT